MFISHHTLLINTVVASLLLASFCSQAVAPDKAAITITATLNTPTCEWETNHGDQQVTFGDVPNNMLMTAPPEKEFHLTLINCPSDPIVTMSLKGHEEDDLFSDGTSGFVDQNASAAKNVGVSIWDERGDQFTTQLTTDEKKPDANRKVDYKFIARLQATGNNTPGPGSVNIPLTFEVHYD